MLRLNNQKLWVYPPVKQCDMANNHGESCTENDVVSRRNVHMLCIWEWHKIEDIKRNVSFFFRRYKCEVFFGSQRDALFTNSSVEEKEKGDMYLDK